MQEYINEYQNINGEFASIISKSLEADNLQVHAKAASFMDDFQQWIELLSDSYEVILYKEALITGNKWNFGNIVGDECKNGNSIETLMEINKQFENSWKNPGKGVAIKFSGKGASCIL